MAKKDLKKNQKEKEEKQVQKEPEKEENLPPFPGKDNGKKGIPEPQEREGEDSIPGTSPEIDDEYITEVCTDLIAIPFEVWHTLRPEIKPLSELEKKHIGKPLARVAIKYDVARFMKDEIMLFTFLGYSVMTRLKVKKIVKDDSRKEGERKDNSSEESPKI